MQYDVVYNIFWLKLTTPFLVRLPHLFLGFFIVIRFTLTPILFEYFSTLSLKISWDDYHAIFFTVCLPRALFLFLHFLSLQLPPLVYFDNSLLQPLSGPSLRLFSLSLSEFWQFCP